MTEATIGQRRSYDGALCTVRYIGEVAGTTGSWLGVEWDDPSRGKHDGQHKGIRYFTCKSQALTSASFVRPTRPVDPPRTFLSALQYKYAPPEEQQKPGQPAPRPIVFSGKVAEEVGFEKIRRQQAQLGELLYVILDSTKVATAYSDDEKAKGQQIGQVCPKIRELDLSRNLLEHFDPVVDICAELLLLKSLKVNWNRFRNVLEDKKLERAGDAFEGVKELALEDTLLTWHEICHIAARFPTLSTLHAGSNQLSSLSPLPPSAPFTSNLVTLDLEFNQFTSLSDLAPLSSLTSLKSLILKKNKITTLTTPTAPLPAFSPTLNYVDLSYNLISTWSTVDSLPSSFPGLTSLRFTHNPLYDNPDLDTPGSLPPPPQQTTTTSTSTSAASTLGKTEEAYMLLVARLPPTLKTLNFSTITTHDRSDAEMFYLSRITKQLSSVPETEEHLILEKHPKWKYLCDSYGEPTITRRQEVNPNFLEARLIDVKFWAVFDGEETTAKSVRVPRAFDIYAVKGIAGRLFGLRAWEVRLVWETGEWDPVGGFEVEGGDGEESDDGGEEETKEEGGGENKKGRWVKREVELKDGPRQFGYCVDGTEVTVRVEKR
ncbi:hypothetical protein QC763_103710 [Podospora pseudopauciseta]|uniref:CAP-Gly domain-containing protein n=2 Tax=Podospora TaxID=5144 RepID=A0ABR0HXL6_9PEZI|nr:hypothetical protein QC763_103710 [Podospora pseudopauciseta]KAK4681015.1 hypothetical protein QC764_103710 [Podospora pseudoanserina]